MRIIGFSLQISGFLVVLLVLISMKAAWASDVICQPVLWKKQNFSHTDEFNPDEKDRIVILANRYLKASPHPVKKLASAGKINPNDPELIVSRRAFSDAGRAAMLALAYKLSHDPLYINKVETILLSWADTNEPTGHPIDETRLEGFIWAYDLVSCNLSDRSKTVIKSWFEKMRSQKLVWRFGPFTKNNNHHTHQLKMILLLDKVLMHHENEQKDIASIQNHLVNNINLSTGETIDYHERNALYYQNFDLEPWLEISLISGCCHKGVFSAFDFISNRIITHDLDGDFLNSTAQIDYLRGKNGFEYAKTGRQFQVSRATDSIIIYYTIVEDLPAENLWSIVKNSSLSPWTNFLLYRRLFWSRQ